MEYKKVLEELIALFASDGAEMSVRYENAISGALDVIRYYEERDAILKAREGEQFVAELDKAWYTLKTGRLAEQLGLDVDEA